MKTCESRRHSLRPDSSVSSCLHLLLSLHLPQPRRVKVTALDSPLDSLLLASIYSSRQHGSQPDVSPSPHPPLPSPPPVVVDHDLAATTTTTPPLSLSDPLSGDLQRGGRQK